jgi:hypothetical protein
MGMNMPAMGMMNGMNGDMSGIQMAMQDGGAGGAGQMSQEGNAEAFGGPAMMSMMTGGDYSMQVRGIYISFPFLILYMKLFD